ncbi:MAG TPA: DUF5916 domain-containing protein [Fluviicola sp.]|nr:DUF5916 domain-containing protein [Fluviicola sp.]
MKLNLNVLALVIFLCGGIISHAQRSVSAKRITESVTLDGELKEAFWKTVPVADSFVINYPTPGLPANCKTSVQMAYDDQAIYFGVVLRDVTPDSVLAILSQRDDFGNADWFGVLIDPYGAGQNGFAFAVTAAGVELDAIINKDDQDFTWNAVWKSRVVLTAEGWSLEMRIPLSQLRFPKQSIQTWRINFQRQVRRRREMSYWSPVDPTVYGEITQSGYVTGLTDLLSPLRLSFSPYTTAYVENYYNDQSGDQEWRFRQRFGMDMKYGLSEAFTLDATLVPDFGQTASDRLVLNLSPFEIRYNENRPFFLEGMDLFGIGDLFYTRRIGGNTLFGSYLVDSLQTQGYSVTSASAQAQLINASKISGRTKKGLGIGVFNAIEKRSYITYKDSLGNEREVLAHPLTNYNIFVLSQNLRNNGNISYLNTNVYRPELKQFSNANDFQTTVLTKSRKYSLLLEGRSSVIQDPDETLFGHNIYTSFKKISGRLNFNIEYYEMSKTFDCNDLGFVARNNTRGTSWYAKWTEFQPKGRFLRRFMNLGTDLIYLHNPSKFNYWVINGNAIGTFRNFLSAGIEWDVFPLGEVDHFESRSFGNPVNFPASVSIGGFYSSDYSKPFALDFNLYNRVYASKGLNNLDASVSPRIRFSNKLFVVLTTSVSRYTNNYGYVIGVTDPAYDNEIILGTRDRWIVNNTVSADYTFTNRMGLVLALNHYWQEVAYKEFLTLQPDGWTTTSTYTGLDADGNNIHNTSYNAFTIDLNFRWVVYPGSEIRFVWKYNIYASENELDMSYFNTFKDLFDQPQLNSFSVKALFFLDAGKLKRRRK